MRVEITELAGGGWGVGRAEGVVWFVAGSLPGEVVEARPIRRRAGVVEARVAAVLRASPLRDLDPCPVLEVCGGCDLGHLQSVGAADALRQITVGALRHAPPNLADRVRQAPVVLSPAGWRLRARLAWAQQAGILGFRGARSHRVVDIAPCRTISPLLAAALDPMAAALARERCGDGEVVWLENLAATRAVAGWRGKRFPTVRGVPGLEGWWLLPDPGLSGWGTRDVSMELPVPLAVPVGAFFQGNRFLVPILFESVGALVADGGCGGVVDLYGGVGMFAAAAFYRGIRDLTVVESHSGAAAAAQRNLPGARVLPGTAEEFLQHPGSAEVTAIIDPPRGGMSPAARAGVLAWQPRQLIMVSCDPGTFGRDAVSLLAGGYRLSTLQLFDLFSGSHHVEVVAGFSRAGD